MCIHTEKELRDVLKLYDPRHTSAVIIRDVGGRFIGGWHCDPQDTYSIANTLRNLKRWHPQLGPVADLSLINDARRKVGLPDILVTRLPLPNRPPLPAMDNDRQTSVEWFQAAQKAAYRQRVRSLVTH